jgi:hypothetical protein
MDNEPTYILTQSQLNAFIAAVQAYVSNVESAIAPIKTIATSGSALTAAWGEFQKGIKPNLQSVPESKESPG